ncbi:MAG: binding-protein-dependent transport system inner rane component, partial [Rhizobacter sp.]|nr:binding-protein-dependent transport system inner rane component [Rhizobacter sp.]
MSTPSTHAAELTAAPRRTKAATPLSDGRSIGTKGQLAFLSTPAVAFTLAMIAFPFAYTVWFSFQEIGVGSAARLNYGANYLEMVQDAEFWNGLEITLVLYVLSLALQLVLGTYVAML